MAEREPGFYWVKRKCELTPPAPEWEVAQYQSGGYWGFCFEMDSVTEDEIAEIGERVERRMTLAEMTERAKGSMVELTLSPEILMLFIKPQPITDAQKTGERFLVWYEPDPDSKYGANPGDDPARENGWQTAWWDGVDWTVGGEGYENQLRLIERRVIYYLPLPPDVKP